MEYSFGGEISFQKKGRLDTLVHQGYCISIPYIDVKFVYILRKALLFSTRFSIHSRGRTGRMRSVEKVGGVQSVRVEGDELCNGLDL